MSRISSCESKLQQPSLIVSLKLCGDSAKYYLSEQKSNEDDLEN